MSHRPRQFYLTHACHKTETAEAHYLTLQYARDKDEAIRWAGLGLDPVCPIDAMPLSSPRVKGLLARWFRATYVRALIKDPYLNRWTFTTETVRS